MGHSNGYITAPINTDDVSATLGVASHDVGTLCTSGNINKWAKYKPVRVDTPAEINEAQRKAVNHGLAVTTALKSDGTMNIAEWSYDKPDGAWWKRLADFIGYVHTSKPPIYIMSDEPDEAGCTVVTWDEGTTKIDDFKILAGYTCGNSIVGPPSQAGIRMDELNFGASTNIANCTFGLLQLAGTTKMYLGASQKFNYGTGETPCINFGTKFSSTQTGYNYLAQNLINIAVGGYIEVLPVIDTMDFAANKVSAPNSGLTGFPVGKKLRIYHQKTADWYLTGLAGNMTVGYLADGVNAQSCGSLTTSQSSPGNVTRPTVADPDHKYYEITTQYNFHNNRTYAVTLYPGAFYLNLGSGISVVADAVRLTSSAASFLNSVELPVHSQTQTTSVMFRFRIPVSDFNKVIQPIPGISNQTIQGYAIPLAYRNQNNTVAQKNHSGGDITQNWTYWAIIKA